jgi:hypothetical protein
VKLLQRLRVHQEAKDGSPRLDLDGLTAEFGLSQDAIQQACASKETLGQVKADRSVSDENPSYELTMMGRVFVYNMEIDQDQGRSVGGA